MSEIQTFKVVREPVLNLFPLQNVTRGKMFLDDVYFCRTCEDEDRFLENGVTEKIYGCTAIPRGRYRLLTSFSNRFQRVLPIVLDVPGFEGIRLHGGNTAEDTHGCILVGRVPTATGVAQCKDTVQRVIDVIESNNDHNIETWLEVE
jgi:hypothetical protein